MATGLPMNHQTHLHHQQAQVLHHNSSLIQQSSQGPPTPPTLVSHSLVSAGHHSYPSPNSNLANSNGGRYPNVNFLSFYGRNHHRTLEGELAPSPISSNDELTNSNGANAKEYINSTLVHEVLTPTTILEGDMATIHGRTNEQLIQLTDLESRHPLHPTMNEYRNAYSHHHHHHHHQHSLYSSGHHDHTGSIHHHRHRRHHPYAHGLGHGHGNNLSPPSTDSVYCKLVS